ncbi:MAG: enoyl-CoA hydratase/isomerase family protein [Acidobacteria bacterium]|nr:MAG: enoyl-CoA hydratase/isomerase family protein [Acidobacteriota bacterium]
MTTLTTIPLDGGAIELRLDSPDGLNRLSLELLEKIAAASARNPQAGRFVLTGNARCFSAGADLAVITVLDGPAAYRFAHRGQAALNAIERSPVPFVAAIEGACLGGGLDLALACHARICGPQAYFGHHGARLGLVTGWGGTQRLPRLIGSARTLAHLLAAEGWTADAALAAGLVAGVCPPAALLNAAVSAPLPRISPSCDRD